MDLFQRELIVLDKKINSKKDDIRVLEDKRDKLSGEKGKLILSIYDINDELASREDELRKLDRAKKITKRYNKHKEVGKWIWALLIVLNISLCLEDIIGMLATLVLNGLGTIIWINHGDYCNKKIHDNKIDEDYFIKLNREISRLETKKLMAKLDLEEIDDKIICIDEDLNSLNNDVSSLGSTYIQVLNGYETAKIGINQTLSADEVESKLNSDYKSLSKEIIFGKHNV